MSGDKQVYLTISKGGTVFPLRLVYTSEENFMYNEYNGATIFYWVNTLSVNFGTNYRNVYVDFRRENICGLCNTYTKASTDLSLWTAPKMYEPCRIE